MKRPPGISGLERRVINRLTRDSKRKGTLVLLSGHWGNDLENISSHRHKDVVKPKFIHARIRKDRSRVEERGELRGRQGKVRRDDGNLPQTDPGLLRGGHRAIVVDYDESWIGRRSDTLSRWCLRLWGDTRQIGSRSRRVALPISSLESIRIRAANRVYLSEIRADVASQLESIASKRDRARAIWNRSSGPTNLPIPSHLNNDRPSETVSNFN